MTYSGRSDSPSHLQPRTPAVCGLRELTPLDHWSLTAGPLDALRYDNNTRTIPTHIDVFPKVPKVSNLQALNGILYVLEHGCKWRALPSTDRRRSQPEARLGPPSLAIWPGPPRKEIGGRPRTGRLWATRRSSHPEATAATRGTTTVRYTSDGTRSNGSSDGSKATGVSSPQSGSALVTPERTSTPERSTRRVSHTRS